MPLHLKSVYDSEIAIDGELIPITIRRFTPEEAIAFNREFARIGMADGHEPGPDAPSEAIDRWLSLKADALKFCGDVVTKFVAFAAGHIIAADGTEVTTGEAFVRELAARTGVLQELLLLVWSENMASETDKRLRKRRLAPFVPTPAAVAERMMQLARVGPDDVVIDLGCGAGSLCIAAAKTGARVLGYDTDPQRLAEATAAAVAAGVADRCTFAQQDAREVDLQPATVVALYLLSAANLKLQPALLRDLRSGARVVSHTFEFSPAWEADVTEFVPLAEGEKLAHSGQRWIYLYDVDKGRRQVQASWAGASRASR